MHSMGYKFVLFLSTHCSSSRISVMQCVLDCGILVMFLIALMYNNLWWPPKWTEFCCTALRRVTGWDLSCEKPAEPSPPRHKGSRRYPVYWHFKGKKQWKRYWRAPQREATTVSGDSRATGPPSMELVSSVQSEDASLQTSAVELV